MKRFEKLKAEQIQKCERELKKANEITIETFIDIKMSYPFFWSRQQALDFFNQEVD